MKYAIHFSLMSIMAVTAALLASELFWRLLLSWVALALMIVALAYATCRPGLLLKRDDGSQPLTAWLLLWPYFLLSRCSLWLYRKLNKRTIPFAELAPGLWFARRLTSKEARDSGVRWHAILDLAAEFPKTAIATKEYRSLPLLDGSVPKADQLCDACNWIEEHLQYGPVLVHCALGHGRTGMVVLTWLLQRGHISDVSVGIEQLKKLRASFSISNRQRALIEKEVTTKKLQSRAR